MTKKAFQNVTYAMFKRLFIAFLMTSLFVTSRTVNADIILPTIMEGKPVVMIFFRQNKHVRLTVASFKSQERENRRDLLGDLLVLDQKLSEELTFIRNSLKRYFGTPEYRPRYVRLMASHFPPLSRWKNPTPINDYNESLSVELLDTFTKEGRNPLYPSGYSKPPGLTKLPGFNVDFLDQPLYTRSNLEASRQTAALAAKTFFRLIRGSR